MGRRVVTVVLLGSLGVACSPRSSDPAKSALAAASPRLMAHAHRLPSDLTVVMGVDLEKLRATESWAQGLPMLEQWSALGFDRLRECELGPATWRGILAGYDPFGGESSVKVVMADGIGRRSTLDCMGIDPYPDPLDWARPSHGPVLESPDGNVLLMLDDDTVMSVSPDIAAAVVQRTEGAASALDPAQQPALARADLSTHVWAVGRWNPSDGFDPWHYGVRDFTFSLDLSDGIRANATLSTKSPEDAPKAREGLRSNIAGVSGLAEMLGQPTTLFDRIELSTDRSMVTASLTIPQAEFGPVQHEMIERLISPRKPTSGTRATRKALRQRKHTDDPLPF